MFRSRKSRALSAASLCFILHAHPGFAQDASFVLPPITVTATRNPLAVSRAGSAVDVIDHDEIERMGATSLRDVLQSIPGLYIHESGGAGSLTNIALRGAAPGQTLILVDGVRIGDPTSTDNAPDLGGMALGDIERIEILRGPQSALYGSDAMGGVVQIITRKGKGPPRKTVSVEGGSYGTLRARGAVSGSTDAVSYALSIDVLHSQGFPRYGYRATHPIFLSDGVTPLPPLPGSDPTNRGGATGRASYSLGGASEIEFGFAVNSNKISFDNPYAVLPVDVFNPFNQSTELNGRAYSRFTNKMFDGQLRNQFSLFATALDNVVAETESCPEDFISNCRTNYHGSRAGAEYQGDLNLGDFGKLTLGLRNETERSNLSHDLPANLGGGRAGDFIGQQTTNSAYALQQFELGDRLDLSVAGRVDSVLNGRAFATGRATAAWRILETGGKLRASVGTGAKVPSLYQRFGPYGLASLAPEENIGVDAGIDQPLFENRLSLAATVFDSRYKNLIDFTFNAAACPTSDPMGCYFNVNRAAVRGVELSARADLAPDEWRATVSYTYMDAVNLLTAQGLLQRPRHKGVAALIFTGAPNLRLEGRATAIGGVLDYGTVGPTRLPAYVRLDAYADYKIDANLSVFARLENLNDARYQEVYNYSVAGRSLCAGLRVDW